MIEPTADASGEYLAVEEADVDHLPWHDSLRPGPVQFMRSPRGRRVAAVRSISRFAEELTAHSDWLLEDYYLPQESIEFELKGSASGLRLLATHGQHNFFLGLIDGRAAGQDATLRLAKLFPGCPWLVVDCSYGLVWCGLALPGAAGFAEVVGLYPLREACAALVEALTKFPQDEGRDLCRYLGQIREQHEARLMTTAEFIQRRCLPAQGLAFMFAGEDMAWIEGFPVAKLPGRRGKGRSVPPCDQFEMVKRRNAALEIYLPIVVQLARAHAPGRLLLEEGDLFSAGAMGLIAAVEHFDSCRGSSFAVYAQIWIRQSILREIQRCDLLVRIPSNRWFDSETDATVFAASLSLEDLDADQRERVESGSSWSTLREPEDPHQQLLQRLGSEEIALGVKALPDRECAIVGSRFGFGGARCLTLEELGSLFSITRERARQLEELGLKRLATRLARSASPISLESWPLWSS